METYKLLGVPASKKNSKRIVMRGRKPMLISSERFMKWHEEAVRQITPQVKGEPIQRCSALICYFYVKDKRRRDNTNMAESIHDLLVDVKILEDDNYFVAPITIQRFIPSDTDYVIIKIV